MYASGVLTYVSYTWITEHYLQGNEAILMKVEDVVSIISENLIRCTKEVVKCINSPTLRDEYTRYISACNSDMKRIAELDPTVKLLLFTKD